MYIVTLSFDDGFLKSNLRIAEIYEALGLRACFNIIADARTPADEWHEGSYLGTEQFLQWNELQARGHEIMPHGYRHENLAAMPLEEAKTCILRCLEIFQSRLEGFTASRAVFNFPYNASTPELEAWLPTVVRAFRTDCAGMIFNPLPRRGLTRLATTAFGPGNCDAHLAAALDKLFTHPDGWLLYCCHGLDDEGWGPLSAGYLEKLLGQLITRPDVRIMPAGAALREADSEP